MRQKRGALLGVMLQLEVFVRILHGDDDLTCPVHRWRGDEGCRMGDNRVNCFGDKLKMCISITSSID